MIRIGISLIFLLIQVKVTSGVLNNVYTLSLKDAVIIALRENKELTAFQKRLKGKEAEVSKAYAELYPEIGVRGGLARERIEQPNILQEEIQPPETTDSYYNIEGSVSLLQPLFTGGRLTCSIKEAKEILEIARIEYELMKEEIIERVADTYYALMKAIEIERLNQGRLNRAEFLLNISQERFKNGLIAEIEVQRARFNQAEVKMGLAEAKRDVEIEKDNLKRLLGLDFDSEIEVKGGLIYQPIEFDLNQAIDLAISDRLEIRQAMADIRSKELSLRIAKSEYYPKISFIGSQGWLGRDERFKRSWKEFKDSRWNIGIEIELPIFNLKGIKSEIKREKASLDEARIRLEGIKGDIILNVRQSAIRLREAEERVEMASENLNLAKKNYEIIRLKYELGKARLSEVFDLQESLNRASTSHICSLIDHKIAKVKFYKATGKIGDLLKE